MKNVKKRYWACVFYPDSLPNNWEQLLIDSGLSCCYALHDKDINPDNTTKKTHYHVILAYDGPTTYKNVVNFLQPFNCTVPQPLEQVRGYFRYLTHKDNPEKYQYDDTSIVCLNGFNPSDYNELTKSQIESIKFQIINFIIDNDIYEYADLVEVLHNQDTMNMWQVATNNTMFFNHYITSRRHRLKDSELGTITK